MGRVIEAKAVISGEDRTGAMFDSINRKFKEMGKASKVAKDVGRIGKELDRAASGLKSIDQFRSTQASFAQARANFRSTQVEVGRIAKELDAARKAAAEFSGIRTFSKNGAMAQEMASARKQVTDLERQFVSAQRAVKAASGTYETHANVLKDAKRELVANGIPLHRLGTSEAELKGHVSAATAAIERQGHVSETAAAQAGHLTRANRDMMRGMGEAGRRQSGILAANRRLVDGMGSAGRHARDQAALSGVVPMPVPSRKPGRPAARAEKGERSLGPLAGIIGAAEAASAYKDAAAFDRRITMIGQTADASRAEIDGLSASVHDLAQQTATPVDKLAGGLESLVAQGRNLKESMAFLPSVAKTAAASGSEVDDIAKTADSVGTNFEIAGKQMQKAFDIMAAGGKAGQFELKDMARYLPSLGPAASAIGFKGEKGLSDLVAMLQVMRKGSGTAEEAVSSMNNILAKMESDKTTKNFTALGVDSAAAFKKARAEGKNLVEVFEELTNKALKGDRSRLGELIDDMEFKRGVQALMSYRGEWQKLSQTLRDTSGGTVLRDLVQVTKDAQAGLDRLGNSWKRFTQAGARVADAGGISAGLGSIGSELETVAQTLERINKAYGDGGFFGALKQGIGDGADRLKENRKSWLDHYGQTEDGRIGELEAARDAHRKKLEGEGRTSVEIADAMRIREAEIAKARRRQSAVDKARGAPELADGVPLRMGVDPTAPIQGAPGAVGPGIAGFNQAFPIDLDPRKPLPKRTPLPPRRPGSMPRTIDSIDDVLGPGSGPTGGKAMPVEVVSIRKGGEAAAGGILAPKVLPGGGDARQGYASEFETSRGPVGDFLLGRKKGEQQLPGFGTGGKAMPVEVLSLPDRNSSLDPLTRDRIDPSGQLKSLRNTLDEATTKSTTAANGGRPIEATVKPDQITAKVTELPPVSGEAKVTVDQNTHITVEVNADWIKATARTEARQAVASIPLASSGARPGAVSMPQAASTPGAK